MQLAATQDKLRAAGVETVAVLNTTLERANLYFRYRPTSLPVLTDKEAAVHRAYRVPAFEVVEDAPPGAWPLAATLGQIQSTRINPTGELPEAKDPLESNTVLNAKDGLELTPVDEQIFAAHGTQLVAHFLIDREGVVRWSQIEASNRMADLCRFPSEAEFLAAARTL